VTSPTDSSNPPADPQIVDAEVLSAGGRSLWIGTGKCKRGNMVADLGLLPELLEGFLCRICNLAVEPPRRRNKNAGSWTQAVRRLWVSAPKDIDNHERRVSVVVVRKPQRPNAFHIQLEMKLTAGLPYSRIAVCCLCFTGFCQICAILTSLLVLLSQKASRYSSCLDAAPNSED
jgi:hypothetical protein